MRISITFVKNKTNMDNRDKLYYEEYASHVLENISRVIINQNYINANSDFFEKLLFKSWELYYYNSNLENISITKQIRMLELFLSVMLELKPDLELPEDVI
jgi:hypothetical protein